jgi:hypothetical protein
MFLYVLVTQGFTVLELEGGNPIGLSELNGYYSRYLNEGAKDDLRIVPPYVAAVNESLARAIARATTQPINVSGHPTVEHRLTKSGRAAPSKRRSLFGESEQAGRTQLRLPFEGKRG